MAEPFTHHEIMGLIGPFTRAVRQVDLAASDRLERRLIFKPIDRAGGLPAGGCLREVLRLDNPQTGLFQLTRELTSGRGLAASLQVEGGDLSAMLADIDSVPPHRHFHSGAGFEIAESHRLEPGGGRVPAEERLIFTQGIAQIDELALILKAPRMTGFNADLELSDRGGAKLAIPDDLLAVLGREWGCLRSAASGWSGCLRLRGREPKRSRDAEAKLAAAAQHIAQTLSEPPRRFHERFAVVRWAVAFRRLIPILASLALIAGAAALPRLHLPETSAIRMLLFNAPPLLMMLVFCLRELPRFEIPPWPRPSALPRWRQAPVAGDPLNAR